MEKVQLIEFTLVFEDGSKQVYPAKKVGQLYVFEESTVRAECILDVCEELLTEHLHANACEFKIVNDKLSK